MKETIKNNVGTLRMRADVTQQSLAESIGVSRQTIVAIEKGNYAPSVLLALKIAKFFQSSIEEIFSISYER